MEVGGQLHGSTALVPGKEFLTQDVPHSSSEHSRQEKNLLPQFGIEPQFLSHLAHWSQYQMKYL
jgi:hypothetical protein